ncbi:MAG TPA: beta-propeller fold lactonase family protein [Pyrinomonadaceae bacterium]|jgi:YVTN family beta-propeller protein
MSHTIISHTVRRLAALALLVCAAASAQTARAAGNCRLFQANYKSNDVSVYDCNKPGAETRIATVPAGTAPYGIAADPSGRRVYVANHDSANVTVIDTRYNTPFYTVQAGNTPFGVAVAPNGQRLYVTNFYSQDVSVYDISSQNMGPMPQPATIPVPGQPTGIAVTSDNHYAYVCLWSEGKVVVVDLPTRTIVNTITTSASPTAVVISPDGKFVYVAHEFDYDVQWGSSISVLNGADPVHGGVLHKWVLPTYSFPMAQLALSANGRYLYVPCEGNGRVHMIDTETGQIVKTQFLGSGPIGAALSPDNGRLFVTAESSNWLHVMNSASLAELTPQPINVAPGLQPGPLVAIDVPTCP